MRIGLVNYDSGNLRSVAKAFERVGACVSMVETAGGIEGVDALVLPGVGAFGDAAKSLRRRGLWDGIDGWLRSGRPFLGICLGYQLLFEESEETPGVRGFGFLKGRVKRFEARPGRKIPHMGWNTLRPGESGAALWRGLPASPSFYFVHSYYPDPEERTVVSSWCDYDGEFASSVTTGHISATQFHPEKSQSNGLAVLENFLNQTRP